ncbi:MAG TPA: ubiquitin-like small modifier protein 1 [Anaerolineaceae bacterium]|nr:ubiquitin-like small modifier protein 1 [Anaerolineaceae bacterium]
MRIHYYATLREVTKTREETWTGPEKTLGELLDALCKKYGPSFQKWVAQDGHGSLAIFLVNGQDYRSLDGLETRLSPEDTVSIFPPVAGG